MEFSAYSKLLQPLSFDLFTFAEGAAEPTKGAGKKTGKKAGKKADDKPKINFADLDFRIENAQKYTDLWQKYFTFFGEGFEGRRIREQEEAAFSEMIQQLASGHYKYCEMVRNLLDKSHKKKALDIICETVSDDVPWRQDVVSEGFVIEEKGRIVRPNQKPGLGIEIDESVIEKHPFEQEVLQRSFYRDGSVGDW